MSDQPAPPTADEMLQQLLAKLSNLETQVIGLQSELDQERSLRQTAETSRSITERPKGRAFRLAAPDVFTGKHTEADSFLRQCTAHFLVTDNGFSSHQDWISYALSFMKGGNAGIWADRVSDDRVRALSADPPYFLFEDWSDFQTAFKASFSDPDPSATARTAMETCTQGRRSTDAYVQEFQELASRTGYDNVALIEKFERGLPAHVITSVYGMERMPSTLAGWYEYAQRFDRQYQKGQLRAAASAPRANRGPTPKATVPATSTSASPSLPPGVPMDVDSSRRRPDRSKVTCYNCGKLGHYKSECGDQIRELAEMVRALLGKPSEGPKVPEKDDKKDFQGSQQ